MEKRWKILEADQVKADALQKALGINPTLCRILVQRGIDDYKKAKAFFRPQLTQLHDPYLMKDMDKAVARIKTAITAGEKIMVYGDYDVDGTTSVACMYQFLCKIHHESMVEFYIPHRYREGYGVSKMGIDHAAANNITLIVSLDCGIKSVELIAYAKTLGIDFIVCDHHLPEDVLPVAVAILNPKQVDCPYPLKDLCGCGVGFKLITALADSFSIDETHILCYLELVATAIAADIVPMTGENRVLAYHGLEQINTNPCPGVAALIQLGGIQNKLTITNVVFVIAPRVNAAGRMDDARKAVQLFIEKDPVKALEFAEMLHTDNSERKGADSSITEEALALIANDDVMLARKSTVVYKEHWHKGVVGIVASRLIEKYYRPTVVLTRSGDMVTGSARSVTGFNLYEAVHACRDYLVGYGGHFAAAGLTMLPENVAAFSTRFEETVATTIPAELLIQEIVIDSEIRLDEINGSMYNIICQMEPFGPDNMRPVFIARNVTDTGFSKILKEKHVRFVVQQGKTTLTGIGFNMAEKFLLLSMKTPFDIVFTIDQNEWHGETSLQLKMIDFRIPGNTVNPITN